MSKSELWAACALLLLLLRVVCSIQEFYRQGKVSNSLGQSDGYPPNLMFKIERITHPSPRAGVSAVHERVSDASKGFFLPAMGFPPPRAVSPLGPAGSVPRSPPVRQICLPRTLRLLNISNMVEINVLILIYSGASPEPGKI